MHCNCDTWCCDIRYFSKLPILPIFKVKSIGYAEPVSQALPYWKNIIEYNYTGTYQYGPSKR